MGGRGAGVIDSGQTGTPNPNPGRSGKLKDMKITLKAGEQVLGTADWDHLPATGDIVLLATASGLTPQARSVDRIGDDPSGGKTVYVGGARPTFVFS